jgi:CheY-like chemotaxis protein
MPIMDGIESTREILRSYAVATTSVIRAPIIIAVTANILPSDKLSYFSSGFLDYVSKPYSIQDIQLVLEKWPSKQE